jgi:hypothetical protein
MLQHILRKVLETPVKTKFRIYNILARTSKAYGHIHKHTLKKIKK